MTESKLHDHASTHVTVYGTAVEQPYVLGTRHIMISPLAAWAKWQKHLIHQLCCWKYFSQIRLFAFSGKKDAS